MAPRVTTSLAPLELKPAAAPVYSGSSSTTDVVVGSRLIDGHGAISLDAGVGIGVDRIVMLLAELVDGGSVGGGGGGKSGLMLWVGFERYEVVKARPYSWAQAFASMLSGQQ
jgi:hypothetical protein